MNVLLGDHHALFRAGLRILLEPLWEGAVFVEAGTFGELVDRCRDGTRFDLILMDLPLPDWPGLDGIRAVRALQPVAPLVVVSASEAAGDVRGVLDHGAHGFIPKSSSPVVLRRALDLVFAGGLYVPPTVLQVDPGSPDRHSGPAAELHASRGLSPRQRDVLRGLRTGKSNKEIAHELGLSESTVKVHVTTIFKLLGVRSRTQAVIAAQVRMS